MLHFQKSSFYDVRELIQNGVRNASMNVPDRIDLHAISRKTDITKRLPTSCHRPCDGILPRPRRF